MSGPVIRSIAAFALVLSMRLSPALAAADLPMHQDMQNHDTTNHGQMNHDRMATGDQVNATGAMVEVPPRQPGQGAFAAIAEIVVMLTNDPMTDWSKVDIDGLREHLVDMDEVTLRANAKTALFENKIVFTITGTGRTLRAIKAMIPAHAGVLTRTTAWDVKGELTDDGAILTVSSNNPFALKVVKALGFYGVMATGAHHQAHHLAMAKGNAKAHAHN